MTDYKLVPVELIDRFPEINPSNYDHDDACTLNAWGVELVLAAVDAPAVHGEPAEQYNRKRIGWELERTAMGDGYYGNALRVAKDFPELSDEDRSVLDRYATGAQHDTDHIALQDIAMRVYTAPQPSPDVAGLIEALERVMYCNEALLLPEDVLLAIIDAVIAHRKQQGPSHDNQ